MGARMKANEFLKDERKEIIRDFIKFCFKELKISDKVPPIKFSHDTKDVQDNHRMGFYDPSQNQIWIYVRNRNLADILRTLCHEFVHTKQRIENRIGNDIGPGSEIEREADAEAGYILKLYGKKNRKIYESI